MKRARCERFVLVPSAGAQAAAQPDAQGAAGADDAPAADRQPALAQASTALPPMPFPGPFAHLPAPTEIGQEVAGAATRDQETNPHGLAPLIFAARCGDLCAVRALLQGGEAGVNDVDDRSGVSALMVAAHRGHAEVVSTLLAAGADVNQAGARTRITALMLAAHRGHIETVRRLLKHPGVVIDQPDGEGNTALTLAA